MIELKNITKTYPLKGKKTVEALKGISMVFPDKGMVCVPMLPYFHLLTYYFPVKIFTFSFTDTAVLFGIISAITMLSCIPLFRLTKKTPMEILAE